MHHIDPMVGDDVGGNLVLVDGHYQPGGNSEWALSIYTASDTLG
jgi:hypothetical protein